MPRLSPPLTLIAAFFSAFTSFAAADPAATALPSGGKVAAGSAQITQSGTQMTIDQTSPRAVINWQGFDVGHEAEVNIKQPNRRAAVLNRVTTPRPSQINGKVKANGQVFIVNPAGIVFGDKAQVDVGGIVASTLEIDDADFMAGKQEFKRKKKAGKVVNRGKITATDGGYIALLAPELRNEGVLSARLGTVALAAGDAVTLTIGDHVAVKVDPATVDTLIEQKAMIRAEGGRVILSAKAASALLSGAVNVNGTIEAGSLTRSGGEVVLEGSGAVTVSGNVKVAGTTGGSVTVSGKAVKLTGATIDASGKRGGGRVNVGSWESDKTEVDAASTLTASAKERGNGGNVTAIGKTSRFQGTATARGGAASGNGGVVETSGHTLDIAGAKVDAGALAGAAGTWLLDPQTLLIDATSASNIAAALSSGSNVTITVADTGSSPCGTGAFASCTTDYNGDLIFGTGAEITIAPSIPSVATLTLQADRNITFQTHASIQATGGKLNVILNADLNSDSSGAIVLYSGAAIKSNGGDIILGGGSATAGYPTGYAVGDHSADCALLPFCADYLNGISLFGATLESKGGDIRLRGQNAAGAAPDAAHSTLGNSYSSGILISDAGGLSTTLNSGTGQIEVAGISEYFYYNSEIKRHAVQLLSGNIISESTAATAIQISGDASGAGYGSENGIQLANGIELSGGTIKNLSNGGMILTGIGSADDLALDGEAVIGNDITLDDVDIYSAGGTIQFNTDTKLQWSSHATINSWDEYYPATLIIQPRTVGTALTLDLTNLVTTQLARINLGGSDTDTIAQDITLSGINNTLPSLHLYGTGNIILDGSFTLNGGFLAKADSSIAIATNSAITTRNGDAVLWADANNDNAITDTILFENNAALTSNARILVAGGEDANNDGFPDGGAMGITLNDAVTLSANQPIIVRSDANLTLGANSTFSTATTETDAVTFVVGNQFINNAGADVITLTGTGTPRWLIYSNDIDSDVRGSLTSTPFFNYYGCTYNATCTAALSSGSGFVYSQQPTLTVTADGLTKEYGEDDPVLTYSVTGLKDGDDLSIFTGDLERLAGETVGDYLIELGTLATTNNYQLDYISDYLKISPAILKILNVSGSKSYDGTPTFTYNQLTLDHATIIGTDEVNLKSGTATVNSRNVGTYNAFISSTLALGGGDAANYSLIDGAVNVSINPALLTISAVPETRIYDGTNYSTASVIYEGLQSGDLLTGLVQEFDSIHAGERILTITPDYSLSDGNGGLNYNVVLNTATGTITPATASFNANKDYDGTNQFTAAQITVNGILGETLTLNGSGTATANSKAVADNATNFINNLGGLVLADGSGLASDYVLPALTAVSANNRVTINPVAAYLVGITGAKSYDGTPVFTYNQLTLDPATIIGTDEVNLHSGTATVNSRNVGTYNAFISSTLALGGGDAANYSLIDGAVTVSINPALLTISAVPETRIYDGTKYSTASVTYEGLQSGDLLTGLVQEFDSIHAGERILTINPDYILSDKNDGKNYQIVTKSAAGIIKPATASFNANKDYDGTNQFTAAQITVNGILGETLTLNGSGTATANSKLVADNATNFINNLGGLVLADGSGLASDYQVPDLTIRNRNNQVTINPEPEPTPDPEPEPTPDPEPEPTPDPEPEPTPNPEPEPTPNPEPEPTPDPEPEPTPDPEPEPTPDPEPEPTPDPEPEPTPDPIQTRASVVTIQLNKNTSCVLADLERLTALVNANNSSESGRAALNALFQTTTVATQQTTTNSALPLASPATASKATVASITPIPNSDPIALISETINLPVEVSTYKPITTPPRIELPVIVAPLSNDNNDEAATDDCTGENAQQSETCRQIKVP